MCSSVLPVKGCSFKPKMGKNYLASEYSFLPSPDNIDLFLDTFLRICMTTFVFCE